MNERPKLIVTEEEYLRAKEKYRNSRNTQIIKSLLLAAFPILLIWGAISLYDPKVEQSGVIIFFVVAALAVVLGYLVRLTVHGIRGDYEAFCLIREVYLASVPQEVKQAGNTQRFRKLRNGIIIVCVIGAIVGGLIALSSHMTAVHYEEAEALIAQGEYQEAFEKLSQPASADYLDAKALQSLCRAHLDYDNDHADWAYNDLFNVFFHHQTEAQMAAIDSFKSELRAKHQAEEDRKKQLQMERMEEQIRTGVPFVGMSEYRMSDTTLGSPYNKKTGEEIVKGHECIVTTYRFEKDGKYIFFARCMDGEVYDVRDCRDKPVPMNRNDKITGTSSTGSTYSPSDPYNVDEFDSPEDLYDMYDDFEDLEDAEDYYYSH